MLLPLPLRVTEVVYDWAFDSPSWLDRWPPSGKGQGAMETEHLDIVSQIIAEIRKKECAGLHSSIEPDAQ